MTLTELVSSILAATTAAASVWTAIFTAIAAVAAAIYVELTRRLWREAAREREASLMLKLMEGYDGLRDSISFIQGWYKESAEGGINACERFSDALSGDFVEPRAQAADDHRFRISRFFVSARKLVKAGYLTERMVSEALGGRAIQDVFLKLVDPLDATVGESYGTSDREFYQAMLKKYPRPATKRG